MSKVKQEIIQIKKVYDERLLNVNKEHKEIIEKLNDEHQLDIANVKSEFKNLFDIENEAQKKYYLQTIEELKHQYNDLLLKDKTEQLTKTELDEEFIKEKNQLEKHIEFLQNQIQQIQIKYQLEFDEQKELFNIKSNDYEQLQKQFEKYKLNYNANSNNLSELNEQVDEEKKIWRLY